MSSIDRDSLVLEDTRRRNRVLACVSLAFAVVCLVWLDRLGWPRFLPGGVFLFIAAWLWTSYRLRCIHKVEGSIVQLDSKLTMVTDESASLGDFHMVRVTEHDTARYVSGRYHRPKTIPELLHDVAEDPTKLVYDPERDGGFVADKAYSVTLVGTEHSFEIGVADSPITANKRAEAFGDWLDKRVVPFKKN